MIKVYLTKSEKRKLKREAKIFGMTMSSYMTHRLLSFANDAIVGQHPPKGRNSVFHWNLTPANKTAVEMGAWQEGVSASAWARSLALTLQH